MKPTEAFLAVWHWYRLVSLLLLGKAVSTSKGTGLAPFTGGQLNDWASPAPAEVSLSRAFPHVSGWTKTFSTPFGFYVHVHCARPSSEPSSSFLSNQQQYNDAFYERVPFRGVKLDWARLHHFISLLVIINGLEMILQASMQTKVCFKGCYTWNTSLAAARLKANSLLVGRGIFHYSLAMPSLWHRWGF